MSGPPFFSVIIPTYNRATLLSRSIGSVLNQDFDDFELIVVDDGSTDDTKNVVNSFVDSRIRYYFKQNQERNFARNFGIEKATGRYICFLDSDDYYLLHHLSTARRMIFDTKALFIHLGYRIDDVAGNVLKKGDSLPLNVTKILIKENVFCPNGIVVDRNLINSIKFIESVNYVVGEDHLLWLQLHARTNVRIINQITTVIVEHPTRSLRLINPERYLLGLEDFLNHIRRDELFFHFYKRQANIFIADKFRFGALLLAIKGKQNDAMRVLSTAIGISARIIFTRNFLAVIKNLLWNRNAQ